MEGIVAKRKDSLYVSKRSSDWLKIVRYRKGDFGWLGQVEEDGIKRPAGIIELGVSPKHKKAFYGIVKKLVIDEDKNFV